MCCITAGGVGRCVIIAKYTLSMMSALRYRAGRGEAYVLDYLLERKEQLYENLRDLNFEYLAGKYPEQDYAEQRAGLEDEAARVIAEMEMLESRGMVGRGRA